MPDPRSEPFIAGADAALASLGLPADRGRIDGSVALFDLFPDADDGVRIHVRLTVGLDDGRLLGIDVIAPDGIGIPLDRSASLPERPSADVERARSALAEVAARHYPASPPMSAT